MADYPLPVFHFQVSWGGTNLAFSEVSGLDVEVEEITYRDGLSKQFVDKKMPGKVKTSTITCKRGVSKGDNEFFAWWNTISMNTVERRNITISLLNEKHEPTMTWQVLNAWVKKVTGPTLNAAGNEVAIESMEIAHEGMSIANG